MAETPTFHATEGRKKGQWWPLHGENRCTATFICPVCGNEMALDHDIDANGLVYSYKKSSSVVCPYNCGFHVTLILEGWNGG